MEKFTKFGQLILSKIIKIAVGNLRASPPQLGTFVPGSESSRERQFLGAKVLGTFALGSESS